MSNVFLGLVWFLIHQTLILSIYGSVLKCSLYNPLVEVSSSIFENLEIDAGLNPKPTDTTLEIAMNPGQKFLKAQKVPVR